MLCVISLSILKILVHIMIHLSWIFKVTHFKKNNLRGLLAILFFRDILYVWRHNYWCSLKQVVSPDIEKVVFRILANQIPSVKLLRLSIIPIVMWRQLKKHIFNRLYIYKISKFRNSATLNTQCWMYPRLTNLPPDTEIFTIFPEPDHEERAARTLVWFLSFLLWGVIEIETWS